MHLDIVTAVHNVIIVSGWNDGPTPGIIYDNKSLSPTYQRVKRQDLLAVYGPAAAAWGFVGTCMIEGAELDCARIQIRLPGGEAVHPTQFAAGTARQGNVVLNRFLSNVRERPGTVLEIGSRARSGNSYRSLFPDGTEYTGIDISSGPNVDVVGDAHHLSRYLKKKFSYIFSVSVFEHILMPWKAALEMNAMMVDGGLAYIQSHHGWPLHDEPWDFWRFSSNAWKGLFNRHTGFEIVSTGYDLSAMIVPHLNIGGPLNSLERHPTYLLSACLVKKVSKPTVSWDADVGDVYDLNYHHGEDS